MSDDVPVETTEDHPHSPRSIYPHVTDYQSILGYDRGGYRFEESDPHWLVWTPEGGFYGTADAAMCRALLHPTPPQA